MAAYHIEGLAVWADAEKEVAPTSGAAGWSGAANIYGCGGGVEGGGCGQVNLPQKLRL